MITVNINRRINDSKPIARQVPEQWGELTAEQFAEAACLLCTETEPATLAVKLMAHLLHLPNGVLRSMNEEVVYAQLIPLAEFALKPYDITDVSFPFFTVDGEKFYAPANGCANLRASEFNFAEEALMGYYDNKAEQPAEAIKHLYHLMAVLYRPAVNGYDFKRNPDGDCREAFNGNLTPHYATVLQSLPVKYAYATLLWYMACRNAWQKNYPEVFPENKNEPAEPLPIPGYYMLMRSIAEKGTYGNFEQVEQMYVINMFNEVVCAITENERLKEMQDDAQ